MEADLHTIYQADTADEQSRLMRRSNDKKRYLRPKKSQNIQPLRKKPSANVFLPSVGGGSGLGEQDWFMRHLLK